jgi:hypothetical protein
LAYWKNKDVLPNKPCRVGHDLAGALLGFYIFEYEQRGSDRAKYGARVLEVISTRLTRDGVDGVAPRSLRQYRQFYLTYPELCRQRIGASCSGPLSSLAIWQTVSAKLHELRPTERDPHNSMTFGSHVEGVGVSRCVSTLSARTGRFCRNTTT